MSRRPFAVAALLGAGLGVLAGLLVAGRCLDRPEGAVVNSSPDPAAGLAVQAALAELLLRQAGASPRREPVVITTSQLNAFLGRHLETRRLTLHPLVVRLEDDWLQVAGRTSLRQLLAGSSLDRLGALLPAAVLDLDLWPVASGRLEVHDGRGEFVVERAALGAQRVVASWLWGLLGVDPEQAFAWPMPGVVTRVDVERGRLAIHTRPPRPRGG